LRTSELLNLRQKLTGSQLSSKRADKNLEITKTAAGGFKAERPLITRVAPGFFYV